MKKTIFVRSSYIKDVLFQEYLDWIYHDISANTTELARENRFISESNGEIFYASINKLLAEILFKDDDVFVDLGSGLGKMVLQVYLQTMVKAVYGIELLPHLHAKAQLAARKVQEDIRPFQGSRKLVFLCGDFFKMDFQQATIVFINSICFGQDIVRNLGHVINNIPLIHTIITLRPMDNLQHFFLKKTLCVEGSWDSALCFIYQKRK